MAKGDEAPRRKAVILTEEEADYLSHLVLADRSERVFTTHEKGDILNRLRRGPLWQDPSAYTEVELEEFIRGLTEPDPDDPA